MLPAVAEEFHVLENRAMIWITISVVRTNTHCQYGLSTSASISHVCPRVRRKPVSTALILRVVFYPRPGRVIRAAWFLQSLVAGKEVEVESKVAVSIYHVTVH